MTTTATGRELTVVAPRRPGWATATLQLRLKPTTATGLPVGLRLDLFGPAGPPPRDGERGRGRHGARRGQSARRRHAPQRDVAIHGIHDDDEHGHVGHRHVGHRHVDHRHVDHRHIVDFAVDYVWPDALVVDDPVDDPSMTPSTTLVPTVSAPSMVSRAGWQADESMRTAAPLYASAVKVMFVHHTDTTNDYSCSQSPAIVRSLYAYHVLSLGWNDIGYNFLVDKCGTLFEGRFGGSSRAVVGAQTYGFNTGTSGVAIIGTYTGTAASTAALSTVAHLAAWKLAAYGISPSATSTLVEGAADSPGFTAGRTYSFAAISGHRDGYATACPGDALYAQLPAIRALAVHDAQPAGLALATVSGATYLAGRYYTTGRLTITWTDATPASQLAGYTVLVDGQPTVATAAGIRSATVTLAAGSHTVTVRATELPSATTSPSVSASAATPTVVATTATGTTGTATGSATATVISDAIPPTFAASPALGLRAGTVNAAGIPVAVTWRADDNSVLAGVSATAPTAATFSPGATVWNTTAGPGTGPYTLAAVDAAGNTTTASTTGTAMILSETAAVRTGRWATTKNINDLGGTALTSTTPNAALAWTFTGHAVAWIAMRAATCGQALVYLDGVKVATVDLRAAATAYRQVVWTRNGLPDARHTLKVVVVGTARRPTVTTDGIAYVS